MKKILFNKQLLTQNVKMDGSINFQTNGNINVYPCPWEHDGSLGPKYLTIFETAHGQVKMTREHSRKNPNRGCVKVEFRFPKAYPLELTKQLYREESEEVNAFLATRKTNTLWINNND